MSDLKINGASFALQYKRTTSRPIDSTETWETLEQARKYAQNVDATQYVPYNGQIISVLENGSVYKLTPDTSIATTDGRKHFKLEEIESTAANNDKYLRRDIPETIQNLWTFLKGISVKGEASLDSIKLLNDIKSSDFVVGSNGFGLYKDEQGNYHLDVDMVDIRKRLNVEDIQVEETTYVGGRNYTTVGGGIRCSSVTIVGNAYKCSFNTSNGDGVVIRNKFQTGDMAIHETFNLKSGTHRYWREVVGVGEDYILLSIPNCEVGSDVPQVGDEICHLGNISDPERQGAVVTDAITEGGPYIRVYRNIGADESSRYTLPAPLIDLNPYQSIVKAKFINESNGKDINNEIEELRIDFGTIKEQVDKEFTIWFYDYEPTLSNEPAVQWVTDDLKNMHNQDLFYNQNEGKAYRFQYDEAMGTYGWYNITDAETLRALEKASKAQDTADSKRRVFVDQPTTNSIYDIGDQWLNATYTDESVSYKNDMLVCVVAKSEGQPFSITHWQPSSTATTAYLENLGNEIILAVTNSNKGIEAAKEAAKEAKNAALEAFEKAEGALEKATEVDEYISALDVTASDITAVVQGTKFDKNGDITNLSALVLEDNFTSLLNKKIAFDENGKIKAESTSGLVLSNNFSTLFSEQATEYGVVKRADLTTYVQKNEDGSLESGVTIKADQIELFGTVVANGTFVVDTNGNLSLNNITATNGVFDGIDIESASITGKITCSNNQYDLEITPSGESSFPSIQWKIGSSVYGNIGFYKDENNGSVSGGLRFYSSGGNIQLSNGQLSLSGTYSCRISTNTLSDLSGIYPTHAGLFIMSPSSAINPSQTILGVDKDNYVCIWSSRWARSKSSVNIGAVYLDGEVLKVRLD